MKQFLLLIISALFIFTSCERETLNRKPSTTVRYGINGGATIQEFYYDGCEYIGHLAGGDRDWATHKGNCTNPIHQNQ